MGTTKQTARKSQRGEVPTAGMGRLMTKRQAKICFIETEFSIVKCTDTFEKWEGTMS